MPGSVSMSLARRPELVVKPLGERGEHVVKDTRTGGPITQQSIAAVLGALSTQEGNLDGVPSLAGETAGMGVLHDCLAQTEGG